MRHHEPPAPDAWVGIDISQHTLDARLLPADGRPFFSLEFCGGGSLEKKLGGVPLPPQEAARLAETLVRAMHAAHQAGVVHRDLKPANVLLAKDGTPKITDFGLAKKLDEAGQTATGAVMGTPSYMAPEQADGKSKKIGPLTDVYALGAILYELLTGRPPFRAATPLDTILQVVSDEPVSPRQLQPKTPRDLETICLKCLQKEPGNRYVSAAALADDLRRFQNGEPIQARPVGRIERGWRWCRRKPVGAALVAVLILGTAVATGLTVWARGAQNRAKEAQQQEEDRLLEGLLRPIGQDWKPVQDLKPDLTPVPGPITAQQQALADLARLDSRLRLRFLERALSQPETAVRLARQSGPVIKAVVAEDAKVRETTRDLALRALRKKDDDVRVRVAGTCLLLSLGESMPEYAREGTLALAVAVVGFARIGGAVDLANLSDVNSYSRLLEALAHHLSAADARDVGRTVLDLARGSPDLSVRSLLLKAVASIAARMEPAEAAQVCADASRALVEAVLRGHPGADQLAQLAPYLSAPDALDAATQLARGISKKPNSSLALATGIASLAQRLPEADASRLCRAAAEQLVQDIPQGTAIDGPQAQQLGALGRHMDPAEAARLCASVVPSLIQAILDRLREGEFIMLKLRIDDVEALAPCMAPATAGDAATLLCQAIPNQISVGNSSALLAQAVAALAQRMDAAEAAKVCAAAATPLVESLPKVAALQAQSRVKSAALLARRMDPADRARLCAAVVPLLVQFVSKEKGLLQLSDLADTIAILAPSMTAAESAKVTATTAAALLDALDKFIQRPVTDNLLARLELGTGLFESHAIRAFGALARRMAPRDVADLLGRRSLSARITDGILRELASVAGRQFQTIDEAVRWFRDRKAAPQAP
jgi:hypothetical protein